MSIDFSKTVYALAPLAGFTDLPFRGVVKKFGADLTVSEMISSNALVHNSKRTYKMLEKSPTETPYSIQIAGSDLNVIRKAVEIINERDDVDIIDLNCGCPAPKVVNNMQGSSLLLDLPKMGEVIKTIKKYSNKSMMSVKFRLGYNDKNHLEIAKVCQDSGADFVAVHGRTRAGRYKAPVDYEAIAQIKSNLSIPVLANGDIDSVNKAEWVLDYTGADGVMIGRAAVGRPWIFKQLKDGMNEPTGELIREVVLEHFDQMIAHYGRYGAVIFRKNLHSYSKAGYPKAGEFRNKINFMDDESQMREVIDEFFSQEFIGS